MPASLPRAAREKKKSREDSQPKPRDEDDGGHCSKHKGLLPLLKPRAASPLPVCRRAPGQRPASGSPRAGLLPPSSGADALTHQRGGFSRRPGEQRQPVSARPRSSGLLRLPPGSRDPAEDPGARSPKLAAPKLRAPRSWEARLRRGMGGA